MFFKICQECQHFFYSEESFNNHPCLKPAGEVQIEAEKTAKKEAEKKANTPPPAPPEKDPEVAKKEQHKKLLIAMKTRLNGAGADASTLKYDATEKLYIEQFGKKEFDDLQKAIVG